MIRFLVLIIFVSLFPVSAQAASKDFFNLIWPSPAQTSAEDFRPYSQDPMQQQNRQWDSDGWQPQHWVNSGKGVGEVVDGFFNAGLLVEQDVNCDGIPTLKVGEKFFRLSYREQNRIAAFMDYAYGITSKSSGGAYYLTFRRRADVVGVYTPSGLQMH